jgi:hypothetical protein
MKKFICLLCAVLLCGSACISCHPASDPPSDSSQESGLALYREQLSLLGSIEKEFFDEQGHLVAYQINDGNALLVVMLYEYSMDHEACQLITLEEINGAYLDEITTTDDWSDYKRILTVDGAVYEYSKALLLQGKGLWLSFLYLPLEDGRYVAITVDEEESCVGYASPPLASYPLNDQSAFVARLLCTQTAGEAVAEWRSFSKAVED